MRSSVRNVCRVCFEVAVACALFVLTQAGTILGKEPGQGPEHQAPSTKSAQARSKTSKIQIENAEFMQRYVNLPPRERVDVWRHANSRLKYVRATVDWRVQSEMESALIAAGIDAVPYLSETLRTGDKMHQIRTLKVLCDMDRFVPDAEISLEAAKASVYAKALGRGGRVDPFVPVDGRRIGRGGYEAVLWAAKQQENETLQFFARFFTGEIRKDLENLPTAELVQRWRESVIKCQVVIREAEFPEASMMYKLIEAILMERMPSSIPPLVDALEHDTDPYVRAELISIFQRADLCSVRLRKIEEGRNAIKAVLSALNRGPLAPFYKRDLQRQDIEHLPAQFLRDEVYIGRASKWALYAQALQSFYGDNIIPDFDPKWIRDPKPEMRSFVTYLTEKDPYFPRWEYVNCGAPPADEAVRQGFRDRMDRLHNEWKFFEADKGLNPTAPSN